MAAYKLLVKNAKVILKTVTNAVLNISGIKDLLTGTGSVDSNNKINWTLQEYTNTAANFTSINPVLLLGQKGIETDGLLTAPKFKIGDGVTAWNSLPYFSSGGSSGVQSVTGPQVDDTDPNNPIVNPLGLIQIIDKQGDFFTDLATASAYIRTMWVTPPTITNESFDSGVYYFTVPSGTIIEGYFLTDTVGGLSNNASVIDPLGLLVEFQSGANFVLNNGSHVLRNCTFADSDFYQFTGNVLIKNIVDIFTTLGNSFAEFSTGKFIIEGNIGPLETAQYTPFFRNSTSTIFVNASKYTSNSGAIHGDLQTAIANGCNVQFDGINLVKQNFDKDKNNFRLSLTSGLSVTTSDVVNAQTIYCTPHNGNVISLYDGTKWNLYESNEFSLALGALSPNNYDVFCYANAGVPTLEFTAWTNYTTRATSLTKLNGVTVKSGNATRRYLGSFESMGNQSATVTISNATPAVVTYAGHGLKNNAPVVFTTTGTLPSGLVAGNTYYLADLGTATANTFNVSATPGGALITTTTSGSGTHTCTVGTYTEDSNANRCLENFDNAVLRMMYRAEKTASWTYNSVLRQVNANLLNQINFINGSEQYVSAVSTIRVACSNALGLMVFTINLNDISTYQGSAATYVTQATAGDIEPVIVNFNKQISVGKNYLSICEASTHATTTWYGGTLLYCEITGYKLG